jgi:orotate phosphoribosyltransferase
MSADPSAGLADRLLRASELHGDFVLSSGRRSSVYFDKFRFLADPALLRELAVAVAAIVPKGATHLAAPEGAATLLLAAVALETGLPLSVIRREAKAYGTMSQVEGYAPKHARVALIEDVSTTGTQVLAAARAIEEREAEVAVIVLALDRGGADALTEAGYAVRSVVSLRPDA